MFLDSCGCRGGVDRRGFGYVSFFCSPLISGSLDYTLSWNRFVLWGHEIIGEGGGGVWRRCGAVFDRFSVSIVFWGLPGVI